MKLRKERGPWALAYGPAEVDSSNPTLTNDEAHKMLRSYVSFTGSILYSGNLPFKQCSSSACQFLGTCHSSDAAPRHAVSGNLPFKRCSSPACSFWGLAIQAMQLLGMQFLPQFARPVQPTLAIRCECQCAERHQPASHLSLPCDSEHNINE